MLTLAAPRFRRRSDERGAVAKWALFGLEANGVSDRAFLGARYELVTRVSFAIGRSTLWVLELACSRD